MPILQKYFHVVYQVNVSKFFTTQTFIFRVVPAFFVGIAVVCTLIDLIVITPRSGNSFTGNNF